MTEHQLAVKNKQEISSQEQTRSGRTYVPDVDICETSESLWLWADMPGTDEKSINVDLADGVLTIEGQVSLEEYDNLAPMYTEYNVGNYARRFTLSREIDTDRIKARMKNGVLEVELPKSDRAKPRRIKVEAS